MHRNISAGPVPNVNPAITAERSAVTSGVRLPFHQSSATSPPAPGANALASRSSRAKSFSSDPPPARASVRTHQSRASPVAA
jgi:hypothetical protein